MNAPARYQLRAFGHTVLRIGFGILIFVHGASKLFGWFGGVGPDHGRVPLQSLLGAAGAIEVVGAVLMIIGLLTRPAALVMFLEMVYAFVRVHTMGHHDARWWVNGGELALAYGLVWLYFACAGAGPFSIDATSGKLLEWKIPRHEPVAHRDIPVNATVNPEPVPGAIARSSP